MGRRLIVCLTGMPGAGKSTVATFLKEKGFESLTMGDAVRDEARSQGLEPTDANLGRLMLQLREKYGQGAVANLILKRLEEAVPGRSGRNIVIDGVRSVAEVEVLRRAGLVRLLAIHASQDIRFQHLRVRGRSDAPATASEFAGRDQRELSVGISEAIALADESLSNNELTLEQLKKRACEIVDEWLSEAEKS